MRNRLAVGASLTAVLLVGSVLAEAALKSGPQPGEGCSAFAPLNVTGKFAGNKQCLV
jgi:hypothetical protein